MVKNAIVILACLVLLVGCSSPAQAVNTPKPVVKAPSTVAPTPAPAGGAQLATKPAAQAAVSPPAAPAPVPAPAIPNDLVDVLKRLSAVEGKVTMLESNLKLFSQNTPASLKNMQAQIDAYAGYKYDIDTIKSDLASIKARLVVIEAKLGIIP